MVPSRSSRTRRSPEDQRGRDDEHRDQQHHGRGRAIAQLELVQGKSSSTRSDILAEMKSATSYYSETIRSNLSATLSNLTRSKRINQVGKDTYALSATERKQLEAKLANIQ